MPEGDTIFRTAATLRKAIDGQRITSFRSSLPELREANLEGLVIEKIEPQGKNLLIHFSDGRVLHTHMMMTGSWHVYRPGERWLKPDRQARVVIGTDKFTVVCFNAPVVRLLSRRQFEKDSGLRSLGPDLLQANFDLEEVMRRLRQRNHLEIGEALLAQRALAGIGNIYKCETLFLCGVNPFARVEQLSDEALRRLVLEAQKWMRANLTGPMRTIRRGLGGERFWVYGRSRQQCLRCGGIIRMKRQGATLRSTYWCETCQREPASTIS